MDEKRKELNNNNYLIINTENYTKSNNAFDYFDSKKNENDVLSKAKESILKFQNRIKPNSEVNNIKYNNSEQNQQNKNIYYKETFYKDIQLEEPDNILYSNNTYSSGGNILQNNYINKNKNKDNTNANTNINKNKNLNLNNNFNNDSSSPISDFSYNKANNNLKYNTEYNNKFNENKFSIIDEEDEYNSLYKSSIKEDKENEKIKEKDDIQNIIKKTVINNNNSNNNNYNKNKKVENKNMVKNRINNMETVKNDNTYDKKFKPLKKEYGNILENKKNNRQKNDKFFNNILEENEILKIEINKLIDENRYLKNEKKNNKNETPHRKRNNTTKNIKKNISSNISGGETNDTSISVLKSENAQISKKNDELLKQIKELKNRNKIQKKRIDDIEQILKDKTEYITQMEAKNKENNSNLDKNHIYKTKYTELLTRFDIVNKELAQSKKTKSKYNELLSEHEKLKTNYNNLLKDQDKSDDNKKENNNEYKKRINKLEEDNKALNELIDKLKKEKISFKNSNNKINNYNNSNNNIINDLNDNENLKKVNNDINMSINELKFENNSLKDKCSEVQNKNKELQNKINELQNICDNNKKEYIQNINKLQKDIIDFKQKELQEKSDLENNVTKLLFENTDLKDANTKLLNENQSLIKIKNDFESFQKNNNNNNLNISNNDKIIALQKQIKELIQYKNKCNNLEKNIYQLKLELKKPKSKNIQIANKQFITFISKKNTNNIGNNKYERGANLNINKLEEYEKEKKNLNSKNIELDKKVNAIQKKYDDLLKENNKLETKKNDLAQQVNNLNDLIDLSNQELVSQILDLKKVIEVLHKQIESEINKRNILENKYIKLQQKVTQTDETSILDDVSISNIYKEPKQDSTNVNINESENIQSSINKNESNENYKNQIIELKNENSSLVKTINNLKDEIKSYKIKFQRPSSKKLDEKILQNIKDINDENLIKDITEEMNKWKQEYYKLSKVNDLLKDNISKLEKKLGVDEEIRYLKGALSKKDELLMNLTLQIKEYQSKSDEIILGRTNKSKDKQIEILLNEVKGIRKRLLNMITLNERITDFEDFMNNIKIIQELESKAKDKNTKKAFEQLNELIEAYKLNNDMAYNDFIVKLFMIE